MTGSPVGEPGRKPNEAQQWRRIARPFLIARTELTQSQWTFVMGRNPSGFVGSKRPVERVSWFDTLVFLNRLSESEGLSKCYELKGCKGNPAAGCDQRWCQGDHECAEVERLTDSCTGYRLPTDAEWEYAARAGVGEMRYGPLESIAWYGSNADESKRVAQKAPNDFGLFDAIGNVWEWVDAPAGSAEGAFRGCGWDNTSNACRAARRGTNTLRYRYFSLGFRPTRSVPDAEHPGGDSQAMKEKPVTPAIAGTWWGQFRSSRQSEISWTVQLEFEHIPSDAEESACARVTYRGSMPCTGVLLRCREKDGLLEGVERIDQGNCTSSGRVQIRRLPAENSAAWTWDGTSGRYQVMLREGKAPDTRPPVRRDGPFAPKSDPSPKLDVSELQVRGSVKTEEYNKPGFRTYHVWLAGAEMLDGVTKVEYYFDHVGWKGVPEVGAGSSFRTSFFAYGCVPKARAILYFRQGGRQPVPFNHCRVTADLDRLSPKP